MTATKLPQHMVGPGPVSVAAMVADTRLQVGDRVTPQGYYAAGDLPKEALPTYLISATGTTDGMMDHTLANGMKAMLVVDGKEIKAEWAGCVNGIECSARFLAAFNRAADLASNVGNQGDRAQFTCHVNILTKDKMLLESKNLDVVCPITIDATTGGNLDASTTSIPVPMIELKAAFGYIEFGTIDCKSICSGINQIGSTGSNIKWKNIVHFDLYGFMAGKRAGRGWKLDPNNNTKQWLQEDPEFADDANFTGYALIWGKKDNMTFGGTAGWCKTALLTLKETPTDTAEQVNFRNIVFKGTAAEEESEGCGDAHFVNLHLMQSRPGGPPRLDTLFTNGGGILIENWSLGRGPVFITPDMDAGIIENHGNMLLTYPTPTTGLDEDGPLTLSEGYQIHPLIRNYANGGPSPMGNTTIITGSSWTIGFFDFEGNTFPGDWSEANYRNRAQTAGYEGAVRLRTFWDASSGAFPSGSGRLAGDQWVVSVAGTVDGHAFEEGNLLTALVNSPSTSTYAANWVEGVYNNVPSRERSTGIEARQSTTVYFTPGNSDLDALLLESSDAEVSIGMQVPGGHRGEIQVGAAGLRLGYDDYYWRIGADGSWRPTEDNTQTLGTAGNRASVIYAGTGTINTSDDAEKTLKRAPSVDEIAAATAIATLFQSFKFVDAVAAKGSAARWHFGVVAQDVEAALIAEGLDPAMYGFWCEDDLDGGGTRQGIRYDELQAFLRACGV